jgi:hypothetical protein
MRQRSGLGNPFHETILAPSVRCNIPDLRSRDDPEEHLLHARAIARAETSRNKKFKN